MNAGHDHASWEVHAEGLRHIRLDRLAAQPCPGLTELRPAFLRLMPDFDEVTLVLRGMVRVETEGDTIDVGAGQALTAHAGEWVRYSTPLAGGAEYISVCTPAFSPDLVNRDV